jgi:hypothetical protein
LHHCPSFYHKRAMIYQRFGQGVSNLSTVAELRTFDGIILSSFIFGPPIENKTFLS